VHTQRCVSNAQYALVSQPVLVGGGQSLSSMHASVGV
jgi:hypothetical protein